MRGFKRVDPTANATKQKETAKTQPKNNNGSQARESRAPPPSRDIPSPPPRRTAAPPEASPPDNTGKYCHYFANYGKCNYEERTGEKGGLLTAVDEDLDPILVSTGNDDVDIMTVETKLGNSKIRVINAYGPQEDEDRQIILNFGLKLKRSS